MAGFKWDAINVNGLQEAFANTTQTWRSSSLLLIGHDQKLESTAQAVAVTHHRSHLHDVRRERDGKLQGNHFAGLQLPAESRSDAVQPSSLVRPQQVVVLPSRNTDTWTRTSKR